MKIDEIIDQEKVVALSFGDCALPCEYVEYVLFMAKKSLPENETLFGIFTFLVGGRKRQGTLYYVVAQAHDAIQARAEFRKLTKNSFKMSARAHV